MATAVLATAPLLHAQPGVAPSTRISGTLSFDARATLGAFTGTTSALTGEITGGPALALSQGWVEFRVDSLRTGNGRRDRDMLSTLETAKLAWLMATHALPTVRNGSEAVRLAARSCELTGYTNALCLNALAAAYAEAGQFEQAVTTAEKALSIATASGQQNLTNIVPKLLELYRTKTPYRE